MQQPAEEIETQPKPLPLPPSHEATGKMGVRDLRTHISKLQRGEYNMRLAELARLLEEACRLLDSKENAPPRTAFWNARVLVDELQSQYNKLNPHEAFGAIFGALGLHTFGALAEPGPDGVILPNPDDVHYQFDPNDPEALPYFPITSFDVDKYPAKVKEFVALMFPDACHFEFKLHLTGAALEGISTHKLAWIHARGKAAEAIAEIDAMRQEVLEMCKRNTPKLAEVIVKGFHTDASRDPESDPESDDADDSDGEGCSDNHPRKRRKKSASWTPMRNGAGETENPTVDTETQKVGTYAGIQLTPHRGLANWRQHAMKAPNDRVVNGHLLNLFGCLQMQNGDALGKHFPCPRAPTFNVGAEMRYGRLIEPDGDINSNTAVTQAMRDNFPGLDKKYEELHLVVASLRRMIDKFISDFKKDWVLTMTITHRDEKRRKQKRQMSTLKYAEQIALGQMYLRDIVKVEVPEGEDAGEDSGDDPDESEGESDNEDSGDDAEYEEEESDDDEDDEDDDEAYESDDQEGASDED